MTRVTRPVPFVCTDAFTVTVFRGVTFAIATTAGVLELMGSTLKPKRTGSGVASAVPAKPRVPIAVTVMKPWLARENQWRKPASGVGHIG